MNTPRSKVLYGLSSEGLIPAGGDLRILGTPGAVQAFLRLKEAARADGYEVKACSGWRSFERQAAIVGDKLALRRPVLDASERPIDISSLPLVQKLEAALRFSALPGFSRHHFGTDFDIYPENLLPRGYALQLTCAEYAQDGCFYPFGRWLAQNLERFGFLRPFSGAGLVGREPWHISYFPEAECCLAQFSLDEGKSALRASGLPWAEAACAYADAHFPRCFS